MEDVEQMIHIRNNYHNYVGLKCECGTIFWADIGEDDDQIYWAVKCFKCSKRYWLDDSSSLRDSLDKEWLEKYDMDLDKILVSKELAEHNLCDSSAEVPKCLAKLLPQLSSQSECSKVKDGYEEIPIKEFNDFCRKKEFSEGPFVSTFGDGYGEPYNPNRDVWGTLKSGRKVCAVKKDS